MSTQHLPAAYQDPSEPALPRSDVEVELANTALVVTERRRR
jgi:hypothetical protein